MSQTTTIINGTPVTKTLTGFDYFCGDIFWNYSLLVDNTWPQFSSCFCDTVVIWTPCGFFWLFAPCFLLQNRSKENPLPFARLNAAKMLCGSGLVLLSLVRFLDRISRKQIGAAGYVGDIILLLTMFASTLMTQWERRQGLATSSFSFVFWIIKLLMDIIPLYTLFLLKVNDSNLLEFTIFLLMYLLVIQLVLLYSFTESASNSRHGYRVIGKKTCPETTASFFYPSLTFAWLLKLIITGYKRDLQISDFWDLNPRDKSETLVPIFEELWTSEVKQCMLKGVRSTVTEKVTHWESTKRFSQGPLL